MPTGAAHTCQQVLPVGSWLQWGDFPVLVYLGRLGPSTCQLSLRYQWVCPVRWGAGDLLAAWQGTQPPGMLLVSREEEEDEAVVLAVLPHRAWLENQQAAGTWGQ